MSRLSCSSKLTKLVIVRSGLTSPERELSARLRPIDKPVSALNSSGIVPVSAFSDRSR